MTSSRADRPRVLVIQNDADGGPRRVGDWLRDQGLRLDVVAAYREGLPERLEHDALIHLGGGFLPDADDSAPWLAPTRNLVGQALEGNVPFLGICLGGQLLAHVGGGVVEGDVGPENGSVPIRFRPEAASDPLFHGLPSVVPAIEHHVDAIVELPPEAVWLARSDRYPYQAFRLGDRAWGVQFHPEVLPDRLLSWEASKLERQGYDLAALHAVAVVDEPVSTPVWRKVTGRFAQIVHNSLT